MAGHWIDVCSLFRGGTVLVDLAGAVRLSGSSAVQAAALLVPRVVVDTKMGAIGAQLGLHPSFEFPADAVVISLLKALMASRRAPLAPLIDEPVLNAILMRLSMLANQISVVAASDVSRLPSWCLRRVSAMIHQRICSSITLADMAEAAVLSPMHFAAQFRNATGIRPHHYLLAQRIDHAKRLLSETKRSLYDVALTVGFRTQAHFCTVFQQPENTTPARWRKEQLAA